MSTEITPDNERFLQEEVEAGRFASIGDALNTGVDLLKARQALIRRLENSRRQLDEGDALVLDDEGLSEYFETLRHRAAGNS